MKNTRKFIKNIFIKTGTLSILDTLNYFAAFIQNFSKNKRYKWLHPNFRFPSDYYLYETYKLDYRQYKEDGELTAAEILEWTREYLPRTPKILEWGCGVARVIRHIPNLVPVDLPVYGTDINRAMINWDAKNISDVTFSVNDYKPPIKFDDNQFDLVFALSVFTHIEDEFQETWLKEISRIVQTGGIFLFTTHGIKYRKNLNASQTEELKLNGSVTIKFKKNGHRMMNTYNDAEHFKNVIAQYFEVIEFFDGVKFPEKFGGQDLWIVKKFKR
ncbi:MAG: class I SAM-dependent methyltransferase [Ferruginibacter sp.]